MEYHYDYIITGAGAAGSSLLMRMMNAPFFNEKKILVIDQAEKNSNDHTWCFWEEEPGIFQSVVTHEWKQLRFHTKENSFISDIHPYTYKMIRSKDLYEFVLKQTALRSNISFFYGEIKSIQNNLSGAEVRTDEHVFTCSQLFNSIIFNSIKKQKGRHLLLQHFKGWFIETKQKAFDPNTATFMDFSISQENGTAFFYVLPVSSSSALVEYTLFTEDLLRPEQYDDALKKYIEENLQLKEYRIEETEFGIIPMTNNIFPVNESHIQHIGTAGGWTKPSTGFTYSFIQKNTKKIVADLIAGKKPELKATKRFQFYDSVFLNVLANERMQGRQIFQRMFARNDMRTILRFLDNETSIAAETKLLRSLPTNIFLKAAYAEIVRSY